MVRADVLLWWYYFLELGRHGASVLATRHDLYLAQLVAVPARRD